MPVNSDKPQNWKKDIARSVDLYNDWFIKFAPQAYRNARAEATVAVESALRLTKNLTDLRPSILQENPSVLPMLRMSTAPPIARDRLIGLAGIPAGLVFSMEINQRIPKKALGLESNLKRISATILKLSDRDIFPWLDSGLKPKTAEIHRAATIVADRLCGSVSDPIIRNAQERRQLAAIKKWLELRGYTYAGTGLTFDQLGPATFSFRLNAPIKLEDGIKQINIPIDAVIMPKKSKAGTFPLMIEAKSAGDFTNTNKRRKEEAVKVSQLRRTYGPQVQFILFLCGYFDSGYLGYEAAEGIDWVWEHRIDDLKKFGL
ncbi:MAG: XamI family restriction endonuclease [Blastocatellia bacterium]|nr:XamI family restriction endonuclease [Blastocatellia bacterium]